MSRFWTPPWEHLDATEALEIVITHQWEFLQLGGEPFYLLQRRLNGDRVEQVIGHWELDPDVGYPRTTLWHAERNSSDEFPDREDFTAQILSSMGPYPLAQMESKDILIRGELQYALEYRVNKIDPTTQQVLPNAVFLILASPPHNGSDPVQVTYRSISPALDMHSRQPVIDNEPGFEGSVRGYRQWLDHYQTFRGDSWPHVIPLAVPSEQIDLSVQPAGMTRASTMEMWTSVPPYVPVVVEHDILVRGANEAHYEVTRVSWDWGLGFAQGQSRLKQQAFTLVLLDQNDPRSQIPVVRT